MATKAYWEWLAAGKPFTLAKPIAELKKWAAAHDVPLLGTLGNNEHLTANNPQDHTPFSFTAWPVPLPGYVVTAIDLGNVRGLGQAIEDQARAGKLPWLKYMNHSGQHLDSRDLDGDGKRWEEYPSSDEHVHLSIRTDWIDRSIGTFDPWEDTMTPAEFLAILRDPSVAAQMRAFPWQYVGRGIPSSLSALGVFNATYENAKKAAETPPATVEIDYGKLAAEILRQLAQA